MNKSKNDIEWEKIFVKYGILEKILKDDHFEISATKINEFREARLMTKFDHRSQLPKLFSDNHLSILPTRRGKYVIGTFETFFDFNNDEIEITQNYDFDPRQTDYYSNAGKYLGLIETQRDPLTGKTGCSLTKRGKQIFNLNLIDRQTEFVKLIVSHTVFKQTLKYHLENGEMPSKEKVVELMKHSGLFNVDANHTYSRRASTVMGWTNWIINQTT